MSTNLNYGVIHVEWIGSVGIFYALDWKDLITITDTICKSKDVSQNKV